MNLKFFQRDIKYDNMKRQKSRLIADRKDPGYHTEPTKFGN